MSSQRCCLTFCCCSCKRVLINKKGKWESCAHFVNSTKAKIIDLHELLILQISLANAFAFLKHAGTFYTNLDPSHSEQARCTLNS